MPRYTEASYTLMSKLHNAHDSLFRSAMQNKTAAKQYFEVNLPKSIRPHFDLETLDLTSESYINEQLRASYEDLLFKCNYQGHPGYLYLLVEHQSTPDPMMAFRLTYYQFCALDKHLKSNGFSGKLPVIYPMLCYHGEASPYPYSRDLLDCFDDPHGIMTETLFKPFQLIDLQQVKDSSLDQYHWLQAMVIALKYIRETDFTPYFIQLLQILGKIVEDPGVSGYIKSLLNYVLNTGNVLNTQDVLHYVNNELPKPLGEQVMTIAEQLRQMGRAEGKAEGRAEGRAEGKAEGLTEGIEKVALEMLANNTDPQFVARCTKLPLERIMELEKSTQ